MRKVWGGVETGKVLASCRMIKQADALLDPPSNEGTESYIVSQLPKRWTLSHAVSLLKEDACLLAPNDASDTTATGEAVRLLRVKDFGATCDVSVSRHGSRFGCIIEYHWHRARRHLPVVVLLTIDAHIILYPLFRGTAHTSISTDVALLWDSRGGVFVVSEKSTLQKKVRCRKSAIGQYSARDTYPEPRTRRSRRSF